MNCKAEAICKSIFISLIHLILIILLYVNIDEK